MKLLKKLLIALLVIVAIVAAWVAWSIHGSSAEYTLNETSGPKPKLARPEGQTIPTIKTADPIGWKDGEAPVAAQGLQVTRFADKLDHPRTVVTLPNGDVLVAETNSPPRKVEGITGAVMG